MRVRLIALFIVAALCLALPFNFVQTVTAQDQSTLAVRLDKLPPALREQGQAILNQRDDRQRARLAGDLARRNSAEAMEFLLALLAADTSPQVRSGIIDRLGRHSHQQVRQALEQSVLSEPDTGVALLALERLRAQQAQDLAKLLNRRLEQAKTKNDEVALRQLAQEQERWISLVRGAMLPAFLRVTPPIFSLKAEDQPIRVLAFGDFGNGSMEQKQVAAAMLKFHRQTPFDFAVTLGDNFYSYGMESPTDPRWKTWWDELYDPLGIKFYAALGNHDWGFADSPAAEILYTRQSPSWRMPAPYYTFTAGPMQFFALDSNEISEAQLLWLKDELAKSRARWKLVYGHHPIYSVGAHQDNAGLIKRLLPILKGQADVYLAGHDHDMQHLKAEDGVHFFVAGGGGAGLRPPKPEPRSLYAKDVHGFCVLEADGKQLKVKFIDTSLNQLYEATLTKSGAAVSTVSLTQTPTERIDSALETAAMKLLDEYMAAWNRKDVTAWERTFHFPHYRLASGKMTVLERPGQQDEARLWQTMAASGWHHSKWDRRHIVHASVDKIHVDTKFTRYRADGSRIGSYESLYILTKEDGRWGVKLRSSFAQ